MARYKHVDMSPRLLPVDLEAQLVPGTFAHALHHLIDELDVSAFDAHYCNDETGATAHAPAMLLRAVLLGYSQGLVSSVPSSGVPRQRVVRGDHRCAKPPYDHRRIRQSLARCDSLGVRAGARDPREGGLIGPEMFAIDGVIAPNASASFRHAPTFSLGPKLERAAGGCSTPSCQQHRPRIQRARPLSASNA
jgi:hypothetical protein